MIYRERKPLTITAGGRVQATSRGMVLDLIRTQGPISRVELAALTGLTQATMSTVVRQLLDAELILETGRRMSTGGKPRTLLELNPVSRFGVGVQISTETVTCLVTNLAGTTVGRLRLRGFDGLAPDAAVQRLAAGVRSLLDYTGVPLDRVVGVGVVAPGPIDRSPGIIGASGLGSFDGVRLRERLAELVGLPVVLDNEATAAAIGEFWGGGTERSLAHATVYMGEGIGAGIVLGGSVFRGASSNAGQLGRTVMGVDPDSGHPLFLDDIASPAAVVRNARRLIAAGEVAGFVLSVVDPPPFDDFLTIADAAARGDALAGDVLETSATHLAHAVLSMARLFDLDSISLAGPAFSRPGALYFQAIHAALRGSFSRSSDHEIRVTLSPNGGDAAAIGAAALILQDQLAPRTLDLSTPVAGGLP